MIRMMPVQGFYANEELIKSVSLYIAFRGLEWFYDFKNCKQIGAECYYIVNMYVYKGAYLNLF